MYTIINYNDRYLDALNSNPVTLMKKCRMSIEQVTYE